MGVCVCCSQGPFLLESFGIHLVVSPSCLQGIPLYYANCLLTSSEPQHEKTYRRTCTPYKDSDQPAHSYCLIRIFTGPILIAKDAEFSHADNEDSDQAA